MAKVSVVGRWRRGL